MTATATATAVPVSQRHPTDTVSPVAESDNSIISNQVRGLCRAAAETGELLSPYGIYLERAYVCDMHFESRFGVYVYLIEKLIYRLSHSEARVIHARAHVARARVCVCDTISGILQH